MNPEFNLARGRFKWLSFITFPENAEPAAFASMLASISGRRFSLRSAKGLEACFFQCIRENYSKKWILLEFSAPEFQRIRALKNYLVRFSNTGTFCKTARIVHYKNMFVQSLQRSIFLMNFCLRVQER